MDPQRPAVIAGHVVAQYPALDPDPVDLLDEHVPAGTAGAQPEPFPVARAGVAAQQCRVAEPLLEQPYCPAGQVQALRGGAALDVGQQDRGVPGPVDVAGGQVRDAVRHDAGADAEQQPVGDHRVQRGNRSALTSWKPLCLRATSG